MKWQQFACQSMAETSVRLKKADRAKGQVNAVEKLLCFDGKLTLSGAYPSKWSDSSPELFCHSVSRRELIDTYMMSDPAVISIYFLCHVEKLVLPYLQHSFNPYEFVLFWLFLWTSYNIYLPGSVISFAQNKFSNTCSFFNTFTEIAMLPSNNVTSHALGSAIPLCAMVSSCWVSLFLWPNESNLSYPSPSLPGGTVCPGMAE